MLDDVFGSSSNPAVPGGSVTKPLMIALLALLASRYMSGGPKGSPSPGSSNAEPTEQDASPTDVLGGLGGLLKQFQQGGFGDAIKFLDRHGIKQAFISQADLQCLGTGDHRHAVAAHGTTQGSDSANCLSGPPRYG